MQKKHTACMVDMHVARFIWTTGQNFRQLGQVVQNTDRISGSWDKLYRIQTKFQTAWASCTVYKQNFRQLGQVVQNTDRISGSWDKLYRVQSELIRQTNAEFQMLHHLRKINEQRISWEPPFDRFLNVLFDQGMGDLSWVFTLTIGWICSYRPTWEGAVQ